MSKGKGLKRSVKLFVLCLGAVVVISAMPARAGAQGFNGNMNFMLGVKALDDDDWSPAEDQLEIGFMVDFKEPQWPVSMAFQMFFAGDDGYLGGGQELESETSEFAVGIRAGAGEPGTFRPYIGGGIMLAHAEGRLLLNGWEVASDDDVALGLWVDGGLYFPFPEPINFGIYVRYSTAELDIAGVGVDAGGVHLGFLGGFYW